jgi:hypothetical protein
MDHQSRKLWTPPGIMPYNMLKVSQHIGGTCHLYLQGQRTNQTRGQREGWQAELFITGAVRNWRPTLYICCLFRFLPSLARQALDMVLNDAGISTVTQTSDSTSKICEVQGNVVRIGNTTALRYQTSASSKVPDVLFFDVPQVRILNVISSTQCNIRNSTRL